AHDAGDAQRAIAIDRAPHEFIFPARLALDVENAASSGGDIHYAGARVVDDVALAVDRIEHEAQLVRARLARRHIQRELRGSRVAAQLYVASCNQIVTIVDAQPRLRRAVVANADLSLDAGARRRRGRNFDALQ